MLNWLWHWPGWCGADFLLTQRLGSPCSVSNCIFGRALTGGHVSNNRNFGPLFLLQLQSPSSSVSVGWKTVRRPPFPPILRKIPTKFMISFLKSFSHGCAQHEDVGWVRVLMSKGNYPSAWICGQPCTLGNLAANLGWYVHMWWSVVLREQIKGVRVRNLHLVGSPDQIALELHPPSYCSHIQQFQVIATFLMWSNF